MSISDKASGYESYAV